MLATRYLDKGLELLQRLQDTQLENIEQAAELIAQAVADGHTLYAWGGPPNGSELFPFVQMSLDKLNRYSELGFC